MRILALLAALSTVYPVFAGLDEIDANGVTETGGNSAYARMLVRTGASGILDTSLLPPVTDWASVPVAGIYWVSGLATVNGNGSSQYPFNSLASAMAVATSGEVIYIIPDGTGNYTASRTMAAGDIFTLCGFGRTTNVKKLTITISGSSSTTTLRLHDIRVGTLTLNGGGALTVRLEGSSIDTLAGNATSIKVVRADMGSCISAVSGSVSYTDSYVGYTTAPNAVTLVSSDGDESMTLSSGRATVGANTVAYLADVTAADSKLAAMLNTLSNNESRIEGLITAETAARVSADAAITGELARVSSELGNRISAVSTNWNTRLNSFSGVLTNMSASIASIYTTETGNFAKVSARIDSVSTNYVAADEEVKDTLRTELSTAVGQLRADVPGIADDRANVQIANARQGIIDDAIAEASGELTNGINAATASIQALRNAVNELSATNKVYAQDIRGLKSVDTSLRQSLAVLASQETSDIASVRGTIDGIRSGYAAGDTNVLRQVDIKLLVVTNAVPGIADARAIIQINAARSGIVEEAVADAYVYTTNLFKAVDARLAAQDAQIDDMQDDIDELTRKIAAHTSKISDLTTSVTNLDKKITQCYNSLDGRLVELEDWRADIDEWKSNIESYHASTIKPKINSILAILRKIASKESWTTGDIPADIP